MLSLASPFLRQSSGKPPKDESELGVTFLDIAQQSGLNAKTIFGGSSEVQKNVIARQLFGT